MAQKSLTKKFPDCKLFALVLGGAVSLVKLRRNVPGSTPRAANVPQNGTSSQKCRTQHRLIRLPCSSSCLA
eukprot:3329034-Amphidinium_carterae.1